MLFRLMNPAQLTPYDAIESSAMEPNSITEVRSTLCCDPLEPLPYTQLLPSAQDQATCSFLLMEVTKLPSTDVQFSALDL